jgi:hypothetical protein
MALVSQFYCEVLWFQVGSLYLWTDALYKLEQSSGVAFGDCRNWSLYHVFSLFIHDYPRFHCVLYFIFRGDAVSDGCRLVATVGPLRLRVRHPANCDLRCLQLIVHAILIQKFLLWIV